MEALILIGFPLCTLIGILIYSYKLKQYESFENSIPVDEWFRREKEKDKQDQLERINNFILKNQRRFEYKERYL